MVQVVRRSFEERFLTKSRHVVAMFVQNYSMIAVCVALSVLGITGARRLRKKCRLLEEKSERWQRHALDARGSLQRQGRLANEVAHELRNPISAIVCAADSLEFLLKDTLRQSELLTLRHMKDHGEYVLKLMTDFIDLSRGASGQLPRVRELVQVREVIASVIGLVGPSAGRKGIEIEVVPCDEPVWVEVDPKHLKQILFNIVQNSIKFTRAGGDVRVSLEVGPDSESVTIDVYDTGIGMSPGEQARIFDPVWQLERQSFPEDAGSGLGLALTKTLVELEGGAIFVTSEEGRGTLVRVILNRTVPEAKDLPEQGAPLDMAGARPLSGQSVLIVEPDPITRDNLMQVLEKLGAAVDGVGMAVDAVNAVATTAYSAVVIDETIDTMSGLELAKLVRQELPEGEGRVFVASAGSVSDDACKDAALSGKIEKPLGPKGVLDALLP